MTARRKKARKKPKIKHNPSSQKSPRIPKDFISRKNEPRIEKGFVFDDTAKPAWRIANLDVGGPWCWKQIDKETLWKQILDKISNFEKMTWAEIKRTGSHPIPVEHLERKAQKRLEEIQQDDIDDLFSLRLAGEQRIWGIRHHHILRILWWDPDHEVCPALKKHT